MPSTTTTLSLSDWESEEGVARWIAALQVPDNSMRRSGIETALQFFQLRMPTLPAKTALCFLQSIDLTRVVRSVVLSPGQKLAAFRKKGESEVKLFYVRTGPNKQTEGLRPTGKVAVPYSLSTPAAALESHTTGKFDVWSLPAAWRQITVASRANTSGAAQTIGGVQLIIPDAAKSLKETAEK
ncbi:hypothetical protein GC197_16450 [bacterium]|nr:hypothetical protein [bacterium]